MPSKLLDRLRYFLDEDPAVNYVMPAEHPPTPPPGTQPPRHWPGGNFGRTLTTIQSVIIHETTGYPTYASVDQFVKRYTVPGTPDGGIGPHFYLSGNGTVYRLIDVDPPRLTSHAGFMNGVSIGIENGDIGDERKIGPDAVYYSSDVAADHPNLTAAQLTALAQQYQATARAYWRSFSADPADPANPTKPEDLTGIKAHMVLHPISHIGSAHEDSTMTEGVLAWFGTSTYSGPQNTSQARGNFRRMLFTEPNYRGLVLLCRYLAEQLKIPRNFPVLPYLTMDAQSNPSGTQRQQLDLFRQFILCDERADLLASAAGTTIDLVTANDPSLVAWFHGKDVSLTDSNGRTFWHNTAWTGMMSNPTKGYRGFAGHGLVGDTAARDSHSMCPGPFFDWHRFSREVWDWWWYCFDFVHDSPPFTTVHPSQAQRAYRKARGDTPLRDYCFDADGQPTDYTAARLNGDNLLLGANTFLLPSQTPVFSMANGVLVAARLSNPPVVSTQPSTGFLLIRHEVFHQAVGEKIDYNTEPSYVYTLTHYLDQPGIVFDNISDNNPDWFNRFLMRLKEAELAVDLHTNHLDNPIRNAWKRAPTGGGGQRPELGDLISLDAAAYRTAADLLAAGQVAYFPQELRPGATPVRVILGDFLGFPGIVDTPTFPGTQTGVLIDIFSVNTLPEPFTVTSSLPVGRHMASPLTAADWWAEICGLVALEQDAAKTLPFDGVVWHYDMVDFLGWINKVTWESEWQKYGIVDPIHAGAPPRPKSRK